MEYVISSKASIEASVVLKLIQHCEDVEGWTTGHLVGLETPESVVISNSFALPSGPSVTIEDVQQYNAQALQQFKELGFENSLLGWYQKVEHGCFYDINTIEYQFSMQSESPSAVMVVFDARAKARGDFPLTCYRLSKEFLEFYQSGNYSVHCSKALQVFPQTIFVQLRLDLEETLLSSAFKTIYGPQPFELQGLQNPLASVEEDLTMVSELVKESLAKQQEFLQYIGEVKKQKQQQKQFEQQRHTENQLRKRQGLAQIPLLEGSGSLYRPIPQPSRLDYLLINGQMLQLAHSVAAQVEKTAQQTH